jgi:glucosyl-3-phosphoglycerate synthase
MLRPRSANADTTTDGALVGDFHQTGTITTLHDLTRRPLEEIEAELVDFSKHNSIGLVLPSLYSELEGTALSKIVDELCRVPYLTEIVIGLDRADAAQFAHAREYFARLPQRHRILWNDGPRLQGIDASLRAEGLAPQERGKGCNVWYCFGYMLASGRSRAIALHDCDIVTYDRSLLARLVYPVARPSFSFYFCKGYYARAARGKLHGRVSRLFVTPLIRSLKRILGQDEYLDYLDSFRYPLAGEFSLSADVLRDLRIPSDWGLEIGVLSEVQRNYSRSRLCQVDVADVYDHKHQDLSAGDPTGGLSKMSNDIAKAVFRKLATQGHVFSHGTFRTLKATYYRMALDFVEAYHKDAQMNGLQVDRHAEERAVEVFVQSIVRAGEQFLQHPMETPFIPSWNRVESALPNVLTDLEQAVEADNA